MSRQPKVNQLWNRLESLEKRDLLTGNGNFESFPLVETAVAESVSMLADLDGDGADDIIVGENLDSWFRNEGNGSSISLGSQIIHLETGEHAVVDHLAADFDGDGDDDIVATIRSNRFVGRFPLHALSYYENIDGEFPFRRHIGIRDDEFPQTIQHISVGDLDGDGDFDILASYNYSDLTNNCTKSWIENTDGRANFQYHLIERRSLDFHGDDPVIFCKTPIIHDFDGDTKIEIPKVSSRNFISTADIDGDGDFDVLDPERNSVGWVWHQNNNGTLVEHPLPAERNDFVKPFDVDHDSDLDFIIQKADQLLWYENVLGDATEFVLHTTEINVRGEMLIGDVNGDGRDELFDSHADNGDYSWYQFRGREDELQIETLTQDFDFNFELLDVADIDNDGSVDLIGNDGWYSFSVVDSSLHFHRYPENVVLESIAQSDVDNDGDLDVIAKFDQQIGVLEMSFGRLSPFRPITSIGPLDSFELHDFDNDGQTDIVIKSRRSLHLLKKVEDGSFGDPVRILTTPRDFHFTFGDLSGDGIDDVVVVVNLRFGNATWYEAEGLGFREPIEISSRQPFNANTGDFDGDGNIDVVITTVFGPTGTTLEIYQGEPGGIGIDEQSVMTRLDFYGMVSPDVHPVDLDQDGDLDLVVTDTDLGEFTAQKGFIFWYRNEGDGNFRRRHDIAEGMVNPRIFFADVDRDGDTDIISSVGRLPAITVYDHVFRAPGDFDGDGVVGIEDVDQLCRGNSEDNPEFDFNNDYRVNKEDLDHLLQNIIGTTAGDVNLDGEFNSADLVSMFVAGEYDDEKHRNSNWSAGDVNCDEEFNEDDLRVMFTEGDFVFAATPNRPLDDIAAAVLHDERSYSERRRF